MPTLRLRLSLSYNMLARVASMLFCLLIDAESARPYVALLVRAER